MSLTHDILKIRYSEEGYLPDYPYHMISDEELMDAFIFNDENFFDDYYPCPCDLLKEEYEDLKSFIVKKVNQFKEEDIEELPNWIYSYMLGVVINTESDTVDIHDLLVLLNLDNLYDEFNEEIYTSILGVSKKYLGKRLLDTEDDAYRPPTMFGESHVIKSLRLDQVSV